jgi:hypothetical protein
VVVEEEDLDGGGHGLDGTAAGKTGTMGDPA